MVLAGAFRAAADAWVAGSGLTRQQGFTLGYIEANQHRGVIARELAEMSRTTPASVASLLQGLEERGLITRTPSPDDSRVKLISITDAGRELIAGFDDQMRSAQTGLYRALSPAEQDQLLALLTRVVDSNDIPLGPPAPPRRR